MAGITDYERGLIGDFFRKANALRGKARMRASLPKDAVDRTPMRSQLGRILSESGIQHEKPAEIVKRVITKASPVTAENVRKLSMDLGLLKAAVTMVRAKTRALKPLPTSVSTPRGPVSAPKKVDPPPHPDSVGYSVSKAMGGNPSEGWERLSAAQAIEMLKAALSKQAAAAPMTPFAKAIVNRKIGKPTDTGLFMRRSGPSAGSLASRAPRVPGIGGLA